MQPKILSEQIEDAYITQGLHTIWVPANAMEPGPTAGPQVNTYENVSGGGTTIKVLDYDSSVAEFAYFAIHMPKSWDGGAINFQAVWTQMTAGSGSVVWTMSGRSLTDGDGFTTPISNIVQTVDIGGTIELLYKGPTSADITMPTGNPDELVFFDIYRDVTDANDTLPVDASLIGVKLLYTVAASDDS